MSDDIEIQKTIRRLTRRYNAPGHELVNDDGPAAVALIEALVKQRDEAIGAFNNLAIESKALTYFNRAERAEAEVERLKGALKKIADHGDGTGCNPRWFTDIARSALVTHPYSDLLRGISREEYEADLKAHPLDEDGNPRLSWEQLMAVPLKVEVGEWKGFVFYGDVE